MKPTAEHESAWVAAFKKRDRYHHDVDVTGFFGHDGAPLPKVRFRVNSKKDDNDAILAAHQAAQQRVDRVGLTGSAASDAKSDPEFLIDMKTIEALHRACRDPDNDKYPAFFSPEWMEENFDADQLGCLMRAYVECRKRRGPLPFDIDEDRIVAVRDGCVAAFNTDVPELAVATMGHEYLTTLFIMAMKAWHDEREVLLDRIAELDPQPPQEAAEHEGHAAVQPEEAGP